MMKIRWNVWMVAACGLLGTGAARADVLIGHPVRLDASGKLLAWVTGEGEDAPYARVIRLGWDAFKRVPVQDNGFPVYYTYSRFDGSPANLFAGSGWAHNPAGLGAMLVSGALPYYAYSGDRAVVDLAREFVTHNLEHGSTPLDWSWAGVPFASSEPGETEYRGADDRHFCWNGEACGRGDGVGFLEPDKVGELGYGYLRMYEQSGLAKFKDAALACANALVAHVRAGDEKHSPWPFRVDGRTGQRVREEYSANVIGPIQLLDELVRLGAGDVAGYARTRAIAWSWLLAYPLNNGHWQGYFEDIPIHADPSENPNQYSPLETARYILQHPAMDPDWRAHARSLLDYAAATFAVDWEGRFGLEAGTQYGAEVLSEQLDDMAKMGSHTARYASVNALYSAVTGDAPAKEKAFRSFNWASYTCSAEGVVKVGTNDDEGYWFSDGYGDYLRHFLSGLAAVPEWAPAHEDHLLESTSVVRDIAYSADRIAYSTFDGESIETFRLQAKPVKVFAGRDTLLERQNLSEPGFVVTPLEGGGVKVRVRHVRYNDLKIWLRVAP